MKGLAQAVLISVLVIAPLLFGAWVGSSEKSGT